MRKTTNIISPTNLYLSAIEKDINNEIINKIGIEAYSYIRKVANFTDPKSYNIPNNNGALSKTDVNKPFNTIINLNKLNTLENFDHYIGEVNKRIIIGGLFIACCETGVLKRKYYFDKFNSPLNHLLFTFHFVCHRILPKIPWINRTYKFFSRKKNMAMSRVELLGRLYYSGFELVSEKAIDSLHYFIVKKIKNPCTNSRPSYYPIIKLSRVGKNGKMINVYKFRTMHPYSEYLQKHMYQQNNLEKGGKIKDDYRVSRLGSLMRRCWIDEIPMLYNLIKGDIKFFGVRPLSEQYYNLYSEELKQLRIKYKPGLIPPYYADMPKNIEEIIASEKKYILKYEKKPFITDFRYFWKAFFNIVIKGSRSK